MLSTCRPSWGQDIPNSPAPLRRRHAAGAAEEVGGTAGRPESSAGAAAVGVPASPRTATRTSSNTLFGIPLAQGRGRRVLVRLPGRAGIGQLGAQRRDEVRATRGGVQALSEGAQPVGQLRIVDRVADRRRQGRVLGSATRRRRLPRRPRRRRPTAARATGRPDSELRAGPHRRVGELVGEPLRRAARRARGRCSSHVRARARRSALAMCRPASGPRRPARASPSVPFSVNSTAA